MRGGVLAPLAEIFFSPAIDHFVMAITSAEAIVGHSPPLQMTELPRVAGTAIRKTKPMPSKVNATTATSFQRRNGGMDPAMKAGIGAAAFSVLIVALVFLAMQLLPVSIG
jgi:hypothetical protein